MDIEFVSNHNDWEALIIDGVVVSQGHSISAQDAIGCLTDELKKFTRVEVKETSFEDDDPYEYPAKITEYIESAPYRHKVKRLAKSRSIAQWQILSDTKDDPTKFANDDRTRMFESLYDLGLLDSNRALTQLGKDVVQFQWDGYFHNAKKDKDNA